MTETDLKVGQRFRYITPRGREIVYTVDSLAATTPQGQTMPRAKSEYGDVVFIHADLLAQDWWQLVDSVQPA